MINNELELVRNISEYYSKSLNVSREFGGPSIYFHIQAIKEQKLNFLSERHIEMIYATLASWGMHRMGDPDEVKAKMVDFNEFKDSIMSQNAMLVNFRDLKMNECEDKEYSKYIDGLKSIYSPLKVSISESTLVAHSKTLAHILPDLIPPIDRQYTVRFFTQDNKNFYSKSRKYRAVNLPDDHFSAFKDYCIRIKQMFDRCERELFQLDFNTFNTSYPKIMDNIIMAFVKNVPRPLEKN